jgi:hypothetical protein
LLLNAKLVGWQAFTGAQPARDIYKNLVEKLANHDDHLLSGADRWRSRTGTPPDSALRLVLDQCFFHVLNQQIFNKFSG